MSNLKKILALVLALVMSFSLVTVSSAAFTDEADINATFTESAEVLANLGVFKGYTDGSFNPKGSITRAEVAAIIYRVATGDVNDKQVSIYADYNVFSDVNSNAWYAGYVNYCANAQYIKGYGNGKFGPNDTVTGYQALAMILRAIGYDKNGEFTGASWQVETAKIGTQLGITKNVTAVLLGTAASREIVAEILFRAINVPQVNYTLALGYSQYQNNGLTTMVKNPSLAYQNFKLRCVDGVVNYAVPGYAVLGGTDVYASDLTWENIGYAAYVWAVPTASDKTLTAVSSSVVYGDSLYVGTDYYDFDTILAYGMAAVDTAYDVYYNGVKLPGKVWNPLTGKQDVYMTVAQALAKVGKVGVKVDFIDNDFGGLAEAVTVTEYTVTTVKGIANEQNTGTNAIVKDTYYFNNGFTTKANKLVTADELAVGDMFTYVVYGGYTYADEVDYATGKFTKINYYTQYADDSYVIGGVEYIHADKFVGNQAALVRANIGKDLVVGTDPYGYMLVVSEYVPANNYLFVIRTNHTDNVAGTTYATVAFADGSVQNVYVKNETESFNKYYECLYTYTEKDGIYTLTKADCDWSGLTVGANMSHNWDVDYYNYKNSQPNMAGKFLTKSTVFIDLRDVIARKGDAKVYTGYAEIPSFVDGQVCMVTKGDFIVLAFLVSGTNYGDLEREFLLYTTLYSSYYVDENGVKWFEMDAIVDGAKTTVTLNKAQYDFVLEHGVGAYDLFVDNYGYRFEYTSFMEEWFDVKWQDGTIVLEDYYGAGRDYAFAYGDDVNFWTLDIGNRKAYNYLPTLGADLTDAHAYVVRNEDNGLLIDEIYIVYGKVAAETTANYTVTEYGYNYYVADKFVTNVVADSDDGLEAILDTIADAKAAIATAEGILAGAGIELTAIEDIKAEDYNTEIEYALALLAEAKTVLAQAIEKLAALTDLSYEDQVKADAAAEDAADTIEAVEATIETVEASDEYKLAALQSAQIDDVKAALVAGIKAEDAYFLGTDTKLADVDAAYILADDTAITVNKVETSIVEMIATWTAAIKAATTETAINVAVKASDIKAVVDAFVALCKEIV